MDQVCVQPPASLPAPPQCRPPTVSKNTGRGFSYRWFIVPQRPLRKLPTPLLRLLSSPFGVFSAHVFFFQMTPEGMDLTVHTSEHPRAYGHRQSVQERKDENANFTHETRGLGGTKVYCVSGGLSYYVTQERKFTRAFWDKIS